jgi:predicted ester cyclase
MSDTNKAVIRRIREQIIPGRNLSQLDDLYTADFVYHGIAMIGDQRGVGAFKGLVGGFLAGFNDFRETVVDQIAEADKVVTRLAGSGTHSGPVMGIPATRKKITWSATIVDRFSNGKLAEEWAEFDALGFVQQLGASLQMPR